MAKNCNHALLEIHPKYFPYRYLCLKCKTMLKIASGIHIPSWRSLEMVLTLLEGRHDEMLAGEAILEEVIKVEGSAIKPPYPPDWPDCPGCGEPALDGHITCGDVRCDEGGRRGS